MSWDQTYPLARLATIDGDQALAEPAKSRRCTVLLWLVTRPMFEIGTSVDGGAPA